MIVDVTAKDKAGRPIEGLHAEDFTVLEDGKPQKISVFEYQHISTEPEPPEQLKLDDQFKLPEAPEDHDHFRHAGTDPVPRQAADGLLLRFFIDADSRPVARAGWRARIPEEAHHQGRRGGGPVLRQHAFRC